MNSRGASNLHGATTGNSATSPGAVNPYLGSTYGNGRLDPNHQLLMP
jgi:hypothetical protein